MTKAQTKKTITLKEIIETLNENTLEDARRKLSSRIGSRLSVSGLIEKVIKRDGLKLTSKPMS